MTEAHEYLAHVDFSTLYVAPVDSAFLGDQDTWIGGLIWGSEGNNLNIHTGVQNGPVNVQIVAQLSVPTDTDFDNWEDISEVSFQVLEDSRVVAIGAEDISGDRDPVATFPALNIMGGDTWHRIRVYARGRDVSTGEYVTEPTEEYFLVTWPSPPASPIVLKATSEMAKYAIEVNAPDQEFGD